MSYNYYQNNNAQNNKIFNNNNNINNGTYYNKNLNQKNQKTKTNLDSFSNDNSITGSEPIFIYDSFDSDSDEQDDNNINPKKKKNNRKQLRGVYQIVKKKPKQDLDDQNKMQQPDEYAVVPRVGSRRKTIVIQDEQGKELSRIVSSNINNGPQQQQQQQQQYAPPNYQQNPIMYPQPNPLFMQPPPQPNPIYMQPPPQYQAPLVVQAPAPAPMLIAAAPQQSYYVDPYQATPRTKRSLSLMTSKIIPEEEISSNRRPSAYRKLSTHNKIVDSSQTVKRSNKLRVCDQLIKIKSR